MAVSHCSRDASTLDSRSGSFGAEELATASDPGRSTGGVSTGTRSTAGLSGSERSAAARSRTERSRGCAGGRSIWPRSTGGRSTGRSTTGRSRGEERSRDLGSEIGRSDVDAECVEGVIEGVGTGPPVWAVSSLTARARSGSLPASSNAARYCCRASDHAPRRLCASASARMADRFRGSLFKTSVSSSHASSIRPSSISARPSVIRAERNRG